MLKRFFDVTVAGLASILLFLPVLFISVAIKLTSPGPALYWSDRIGINNTVFLMPKFRTMRLGAPTVATHLLTNADSYITPFGLFLRRTSLDEIPQLYSIFRGDMSFVGPRPALFNQDDLVALRTAKGIHHLIPGLTGWAQVNGRDDLPIPVKVSYDEYYMNHRSFLFDIRILALTILKVIKREGVSH